MGHALIVVDVQKDFCEGGSLAVVGGADAARKISRLIKEEGRRYSLVVASQDWHNSDSNDGHFSLDPDYVNTWPPHCVAGSVGAEFNPYLTLPARTVVVRKGQNKAAYSAFEGTQEDGTALETLLTHHEIDTVSIVGIALDYCVAATAVDAAKSGYDTHLLPDFTASVHPERDPETIHRLVSSGVSVITRSVDRW